MELLKNLNERQKEAVLCTEGPLLIIAGAGAGKTKVITHRIAYLIQKGVKPENILAVTFTNKAAGEMKQRITKLIADDKTRITGRQLPAIGTFHSIGVRILRENARKTGRTKNFSIIDEEDSLKIIKNCLRKLNIDPRQFQPTKIRSIISRQKSNLIKCEDFSADAGEQFFPKILASIWREYEKTLKIQNAFDFDDLISQNVYLFEENPKILEKYQDKWKYILIDEYQDTNHSQYVFAALLAQKNQNICVVGDEDQSIYGFRGADFGNILNFEKDWPNTKVIMLEENYRSVKKILEAANAVISKNKLRKPKNLFSQLEIGQNIGLFQALNEAEEADFVATKTRDLLEAGAKPSDIAVLYRANFQSRILEELFLSRDLPYQVLGTRFFERKEIKDIIAYLKAALNPNDILSFERIANEPPRGIGKVSLMNYLSGGKNPPDKEKKLKEFLELLKELREIINRLPCQKTINAVIQKSGYQAGLKDGSEDGITRLENLKELTALSAKYNDYAPPAGILKFLEDAALFSDEDAGEDTKETIRLMTVHAAKGLEFKHVFVSGLEEGLFPYPDSSGSGKAGEEEERRLFYVALTRAKEKINLSFALTRTFFGGRQINKPSRFIFEIPEDLLEAAENEIKTINL